MWKIDLENTSSFWFFCLFTCLFCVFTILIVLEHLGSSTQFKETDECRLMFLKEIQKLGV